MSHEHQKEIVVYLPKEQESNYNRLVSLSNEEKIISMVTGMKCMQSTKRMLAECDQREMYKQVEQAFEAKIAAAREQAVEAEKKLEAEIEVAQRLAKNQHDKSEETIDRIVSHKVQVYDQLLKDKDSQMQRLTDQLRAKDREIFSLGEDIRTKDAQFRLKMDEEMGVRMDMERKTRDLHLSGVLSKNTEMLEIMAASQMTKTSTEIGALGEQKFMEIAHHTFLDFQDMDIVDVHSQPHKGDFHLSTKDMVIMVDAKAYKRNVDYSQIQKIKADLQHNPHISFAWLVSLNTNIDKKDKGLFTLEWISEDQCVVYINNLLSVPNMEMLLKTVFYQCRDQYKRIKDGRIEQSELLSIRDAHTKTMESLATIKKRMKEVKTAINGLRNLHDELEKELLNTMNETSNTSANKYYMDVMKWWSENLEKAESTEKIKSTAIWTKFKKENEDLCKDLDVATFKDVVCLIVPPENIVKAKGKAGAMDVFCIKWKDVVQDQVINVSTQASSV
jgi:flagellar motor protein MotB